MVALGFYTTMRTIPRCGGAGGTIGTRPGVMARKETCCGYGRDRGPQEVRTDEGNYGYRLDCRVLGMLLNVQDVAWGKRKERGMPAITYASGGPWK